MKICGLLSGHDCSFAILENGIPTVHHELERFSREKMKVSDSIEFMFNVYPYYSDINAFTHPVMTWHGGIKKRYPDTYEKAEKIANFYGDPGTNPSYGIGHHKSHAANAFFSSNYKNALIITMDGGGDEFHNGEDGGICKQVSGFTIWAGVDNKIYPIKIFQGDPNIGEIWQKYTSQVFGLSVGYPIGSQEGTVMAMSAFGDPERFFKNVTQEIPISREALRELIQQNEQYKFDVAAALQKYTEILIRETLSPYIEKYNPTFLCLAGGVALNSVMVGKLYDWFPNVDGIYVSPTPADSGCAIGSAQYFWHHINNNPRIFWKDNFTPYLGYSYPDSDVFKSIKQYSNIESRNSNDEEAIDLLNNQKIISVYGGKSETGRRALGNRSILADPRDIKMKDKVNEKVKHRQWFRPFAPSILREDVEDWFVRDVDSPYMSIVVKFKEDMKNKVPAVVHADGSARIQTVTEKDNKWYYNFLKKWKEKTGIPLILNTSFNDREPIVETPKDAIECFLKTQIDFLYFYELKLLVSKLKKDN